MNEVSSSDYLVKVTENAGARSLVGRVRQTTADEIVSSFLVSDELIEKLKFSECLPKRMVQELRRGHILNHEDIQDTLGGNVAVVADETSKGGKSTYWQPIGKGGKMRQILAKVGKSDSTGNRVNLFA